MEFFRPGTECGNENDDVSESISSGQVMIMIIAKCCQLTLWCQKHEGGSLTSDFCPIPATSQILIESINRGRGRESPDSGVKSAYVMTCSLARWMKQAQSLITSSFLIISPHLTHSVPPSQSIFFWVCVSVCVWDLGKEISHSCKHVCYFTAILDNDLFYNSQLEGLPLERKR